jgi:hypothetical protein
MAWVSYYWRWFSRTVVPGVDRADLIASLVTYIVAGVAAAAPQLRGSLNMTPLEIFGVAAVLITAIRFVYLPYRFARDDAVQTAKLVERLVPRLQFDFQPNHRYIHNLPYSNIFDNGRVFAPPCRFFRVELVSLSEKAHRCRVFLRHIEFMDRGTFSETFYDGSLPLRWASVPDNVEAFAPRDICTSLTPQYVDVLSTDAHFNAIQMKWPPPTYIVNENLFKQRGVYRLTLTASAESASTVSCRLYLLWPGEWNFTELYPEGVMTEAEIAKRFDTLLEAMATKPPLTVPSETPEEACPTSGAEPDACCDDTQTPKGTSEGAD